VNEGDVMSLKDLEILHDCPLRDIRYDVSDPATRTLVLVFDCPEDMGKAEWDGNRLRITATDVRFFHLTAWGHFQGEESLDGWEEGVSHETQKLLARLPGRPPAFICKVWFHTGSHLELACNGLDVEVMKCQPHLVRGQETRLG
jgi:hypothetical protein